MNKKSFLVWARIGFGALTLFAIIVQALVTYMHDAFDPFNFFGYFTNISNIVASVILIISGAMLMGNRKPTPQGDALRGAAVLYMAITGVVYNTLLVGQELGLLLPWVNVLLHIIMPIAVIADWLYQPPLSKITSKQALWWLAFPLTYLVYTLIRGAIVGWYPYPFLNPATAGGYGGIALYCVGILVAFFAVAWLVKTLGNSLKRHAE